MSVPTSRAIIQLAGPIGVFAASATNRVTGPAYRAFLDELRRVASPKAKTCSSVINRCQAVPWDYLYADQFGPAERRAKTLRLEVHSARCRTIHMTWKRPNRSLNDAGADWLRALQCGQLVKLATGQRIPTMFVSNEYTQAGRLMSLGAAALAMYRQGGTIVGKSQWAIAKRPARELVIRTAKALGIELPTIYCYHQVIE